MNRIAACTLLAAAWLLAGVPPAAGHGRSLSTSTWQISAAAPTRAQVELRMAWSDLERAVPGLAGLPPGVLGLRPDLADVVDDYLRQRVRLRSDAGLCEPSGPGATLPGQDRAHLRQRLELLCPGGAPLELAVELFRRAPSGHTHLARLRVGDGPVREQVFSAARRSAAIGGADGRPTGASWLTYLRLGVLHIATGADHLVFLLALLLIGAGLRDVAAVVTGFTLAHSVTLAAGVLGIVRPESDAIEALIGLSIAVVALENVAAGRPAMRQELGWVLALALGAAGIAASTGAFGVPPLALLGIAVFSLCNLAWLARARHPHQLRWAVACVFGLVHGFGFAGLLTEIGLPADRIAPALLGFNLGVELGQLAIVALVWPLLRAVSQGSTARGTWLREAGSAAVLAAGIYWFLARALA